MYEFLLTVHNFSRWLVLLAALWVLFRSFQGLQAKRYEASDRTAGMAFTGLMDLQLVLGLLLAFTSPIVRSAFSNMGVAMGNQELRFFSVEHLTLMILAVVFAHIGSSKVKRATEAALKHRTALIWYGLSLALVLLAIPWWRPLFRLG